MKRETIYNTKQSVPDILKSAEGARPSTVWLLGAVERQTERRLLGFIPLPDRYVWSIVTVEEAETKNSAKSRPLNEAGLTFDSRKRLQEARLHMTEWLREKCRQYKGKERHGNRG